MHIQNIDKLLFTQELAAALVPFIKQQQKKTKQNEELVRIYHIFFDCQLGSARLIDDKTDNMHENTGALKYGLHITTSRLFIVALCCLIINFSSFKNSLSICTVCFVMLCTH